MHRINNWCLVVVLFVAACKQEPYHLPMDKMQSVLTDIQLAEVYSASVGYDTVQKMPVKNDDSLAQYYGEILSHHKISLDQFKQSLEWYRQRPDILDTVYVRAMNKLTNSDALKKVRELR